MSGGPMCRCAVMNGSYRTILCSMGVVVEVTPVYSYSVLCLLFRNKIKDGSFPVNRCRGVFFAFFGLRPTLRHRSTTQHTCEMPATSPFTLSCMTCTAEAYLCVRYTSRSCLSYNGMLERLYSKCKEFIPKKRFRRR